MRILSTETNIFRWCSFISKFILLENKSHPFMWFACSLLMHLFILTVVIWHVLCMCMCVCVCVHLHLLAPIHSGFLTWTLVCIAVGYLMYFISFLSFSRNEKEKKNIQSYLTIVKYCKWCIQMLYFVWFLSCMIVIPRRAKV